MPTPLNGLDFVAYDWTPNASGTPPAVVELARLKAFGFEPKNDQKNAKGLAMRYPLMMNVKQEQPIDFTVFLKQTVGAQPVLTNLDISVYTLGGTAYLGTIRDGSIEATTVNKESSGIAAAVKNPSATGTDFKVMTKKLILADTVFVSTLLSGSVSSFDVAATITWGTATFTAPMTIASAKHTVDREELQLEDVVLTPKGTPTSPNDNTLLGLILLGTAQVALAIDTGAGQYNTAEAQWALITKLTTKFADADCIEQSGQFVFQGPATYVAD